MIPRLCGLRRLRHRQATTARLTIAVLARLGLVALADCRIEPLSEAQRRHWRELRGAADHPRATGPGPG
jgi:hypothetical protein